MEQKKEKMPLEWVSLKNRTTLEVAVSVAICSKTGRICKMISTSDIWGCLMQVLETDFYLTEDWCEEGKRCLDIQCPLNNTKGSAIRAMLGLTRGETSDDRDFKEIITNAVEVLNKQLGPPKT